MFALDAASRALLAAAAFATFGAAFVATPIVARGEGGEVKVAVPAVATLAPRTPFADVVPQRDPFAGGDAPAHAVASAAGARDAVPALPPIPAALRALPPNAGAGDGTFPFATATATATRIAATVTAVITGPHPFALVDEAGTTRVLTVGDRIDGDPIAAIDANGVHLSSGTTVVVARASEAEQPQQPARVIAPPLGAVPAPAHQIPGGR